jgi:hypothetical protein
LPILVASGVVVFNEMGASYFTASHIWRGRAPPKQ